MQLPFHTEDPGLVNEWIRLCRPNIALRDLYEIAPISGGSSVFLTWPEDPNTSLGINRTNNYSVCLFFEFFKPN